MNTKQIIIAGTLLVSVATFAQKDELKALKKIYAKPVPSANEMVEYKANIAKLETLATEEGDKVYTGFYKAMLPIMEITALGPNITQVQMMKFVNQKAISDLEKGLNATLEYEKKTGKKIQTDDINETIMSYKPQLLAYADALLKAQKYKESAETLYSIYLMDKKDADNLYYAASFAVSGKENDLAIAYYQELKNINYTGDSVQYFATLKATGAEEFYNSKSDRDNLVRLGTHEKPRDVKGESKRPEILKNLAILLADKGRDDEAKAIYAEARKASPDDVSLILGEADLFYKLKDMDSYKKAIEAALVKNPNDADLNYNLGVMSLNANNKADAEKYYKRTIEIDPTYINAYLNFSAIKLMPDAKLVKDMNALGTTEKELKKYNVLKAEREKIFKEALPLLEKAYEIQPENETVKSNLLSVYNFLEMTDKYKALKAKK